VEHGREQRMFLTMEKMDLILRTLLETFNVQVNERKVLFMKTSQTSFSQEICLFSHLFFIGYIFSRTFLWSYFLRLYWQSPYYFMEKSPRNLKLRTLFTVAFCPRTSEKLLFPIFQKLFSMTFFRRFVLFSLLKYIAKAGALCLYIIGFGRV